MRWVNKQIVLQNYFFWWLMRFLSLTSFIPISWPTRTKVMKVNSLIDVSWNMFCLNMRNTLLDSHLLSQSRPKQFLRWKCFESTGFSDNKNEPSTNCAEGPFWNLVQSGKPNRGWKWECHEERMKEWVVACSAVLWDTGTHTSKETNTSLLI